MAHRSQPSKAATPKELRNKDRATRSMGQFLAREEDGQDGRRRILSFSSEEPYQRWFGPEILDHTDGAVDLARLNEVGVLLFNHDVDRVASMLCNPAHLPLIYGLLFAMPGIPCLYYGGEWGAQARRSRESDAALRPSFPTPEENDLTRLIARLARIHKEHKALIYGSYSQVFLTNRQIVFAREWEGERILCAINLDAQEFRANFSCGAASGTDLITGETVDLSGGCTLPGYSLFYLKV